MVVSLPPPCLVPESSTPAPRCCFQHADTGTSLSSLPPSPASHPFPVTSQGFLGHLGLYRIGHLPATCSWAAPSCLLPRLDTSTLYSIHYPAVRPPRLSHGESLFSSRPLHNHCSHNMMRDFLEYKLATGNFAFPLSRPRKLPYMLCLSLLLHSLDPG